MAVANVVGLEPDNPEDWESGAKRLAVSDPSTSASAGTYYLSKRFYFDDGVYSLRVQQADAATFWVGPMGAAVQLVFAGATHEEPTNSPGAMYLQSGLYRLDVILQKGTDGYVLFEIIKDGKVLYASDEEGWVWDDSPIPDDDVPLPADYRLRLPVWSVLPNWKDGILERLQWLTDVMESESGAEQRRSIRSHPRRSFECQFLRQGPARARMDAFFATVGQGQFLFPLFHTSIKMTEGIQIGASGVELEGGSPADREVREGDLMFVSNGDPTDYDLLEVGTVESDRFSWATEPTRAWPAGTRIYPCRLARMIEPPQLSNVSSSAATATVRFELDEPYEHSASFGATLNGQPLFNFRPDRATPIDLDYQRKVFTLDNMAGPPVITDVALQSKIGVKLGYRLFGAGAVKSFRSMLHAARGRARSFYAPSFTDDLELTSDIANLQTYLDVRKIGFAEILARPQPARLGIRIELADPSLPPIYRTITDSDEITNSGTPIDRLYVDTPLPALTVDAVARISYVAPARLDQDAVELVHHTAGSVAVDTSLLIRQFFNWRNVQ